MAPQIDGRIIHGRIIDGRIIDGRIKELCGLIGTEQDRRKFLELVNELNRLLEAKDQNLKLSSPAQTLPTTPA